MADLLSGTVKAVGGTIATTDDVFLSGLRDAAEGQAGRRPLAVLHPAHGYRAGLDAVLLAAAARIRPGSAVRVLDAGAGAGVVGLCVAARVPDARVTLVEKAPELVALARRNIERNGLAGRVSVVEADICASRMQLSAAGVAAEALLPETFEHVLANPPYLELGRGRVSADPLKANSHAMAAGDLDAWIRFLVRMAVPGGQLVIVHRADALPQLLAALTGRFGAIEVVPLHPRQGEPAHRIIVHARKGSRAPLTLQPGIVLHGADNRFLPAIEAVLRDGAALEDGSRQ